ncbi:MAG: ABC transporter ATP-binding protein [candidate division Zixibacteria bacterium]|jgi:Cu-processing system ATP-binding protein|nr:ABC transporter ATP-binding protein [candidate division Zixibacteria bacterium]
MIEVRKLTKRFRKFNALNDVSFCLRRGRCTGIIGPNGSGKSTLIKCLLGLVRPTDGVILVDDRLADRAGVYRRRIGYMPQVATFPQDLTGREVIELVVRLRSERPDHLSYLLDLFDLHTQMDKRIRTLSGGTRQKLSAVVAAMYDPELLILDEPTAGLDPSTCRQFKEYLLERKSAGRSILITTHIISDLDEMADDIVLLLDGAVHYAGSVRDLKLATDSLHLESAVAHILERGAA